ncbi:hypothetical protein A2U01_0017577, partial [Trifolium medium]|nr:hypothetical protein [Trifolium medium]
QTPAEKEIEEEKLKNKKVEEEKSKPDEQPSSSNNKKPATEEEKQKKKKKVEEEITHEEEEKSKPEEQSSSSNNKKPTEEEKTKYNFNFGISYGSDAVAVPLPPKNSGQSTIFVGLQQKNLAIVASCSKNKQQESSEYGFEFLNPKLVEKLASMILICGCLAAFTISVGLIKEVVESMLHDVKTNK